MFVLSVLEGLACRGVRIGSLLCEVFACGFALRGKLGNAGIVEKRGESSAGKVRGGWILFTWGRSLFLIPFKRAVCLGQRSIDFWSGWGRQEVITGCTRKLESSDHFRDIKKGQWKSGGLFCPNYPTLWNLPALALMVIFWGVGVPFILWCLLLSPQVQDL